MSEKTVLGKTLAEVLTMKPSVVLDTIGEYIVFGNTLEPKHDDDLTVALESILFQLSCENVYHFAVPGVSGYTVVPVVFNAERPYNPAYKSNYRLWAWHNRDGQDYAEALERRVAEFRMPPRPLSTCGNAMLAVKDELTRRNIGMITSDLRNALMEGDFSASAFRHDGSKPSNYVNHRYAPKEPMAVLHAAISEVWDEVVS